MFTFTLNDNNNVEKYKNIPLFIEKYYDYCEQNIFPNENDFYKTISINCYSQEEAEKIIQNVKEHFKDKTEIDIVIDSFYYEIFRDDKGEIKRVIPCSDNIKDCNDYLFHNKKKITSPEILTEKYFKFWICEDISERIIGEFVYSEITDTMKLLVCDISGHVETFWFAVDFIDYFKQIEPKFRNITLKCTNGE